MVTKTDRFLWAPSMEKRKTSISCFKTGNLRLLTFSHCLLNPNLGISHTPPVSSFPLFFLLTPRLPTTTPCFIIALESFSVFKMALVCTMEYYSAPKRNEDLIHTTADAPWKHYAKRKESDTKATYFLIPFI